MGLLDNTTITVESSLLPDLVLNVQEQINAPQGLLTKLLRPRVTVRSGSTLLYRAEPAGDPDTGIPWGAIAAAVLAVGAVAVLARVLR